MVNDCAVNNIQVTILPAAIDAYIIASAYLVGTG